MFTLQTLAPGRVTIGVGTGSQPREYQSIGIEWADRFRLLDEGMLAIRQIFAGTKVTELEELFAAKGNDNAYGHWLGGAFGEGDPWESEPTWPVKVGTPRFILGAWYSDAQLQRAASAFDGWMASGGAGAMFGGWVKMKDAIKRYRSLGGTRALMTSVECDLATPTTHLDESGAFHLRCGPEAATERLLEIEEIGFDDVILSITDHRSTVLPGPRQYDITTETLEQIRALLPKAAPAPAAP